MSTNGMTRREFVATTGAATSARWSRPRTLQRRDQRPGPRSATPWSGPASAASACGDARSSNGFTMPSSSSASATSTRCASRWRRSGSACRCPTFTNLDEMLDKVKPTHLMVTTVDAFHGECIVKALKRGVNVITEKPMIDRRKAVPDGARRRARRRQADRRDVQLPLRAQAPEDQGTPDVGRDRQGHVGRFLVVSRHQPRRGLLPPLAPAARAAADRSGCTRRRITSI